MAPLANREVPLIIRRVRRARHFTLHWRPVTRDVLLTMPLRAPLATAMAFVESRKAWLEREMQLHGQHVPFAGGASIPLLGVPHTVRHLPERRGTVSVEGSDIIVCGAEEFLARRLRDWLIAHGRGVIEPMAHAQAEAIGRRIRRITLRDNTSRWGSCGASGVLSFSWRLVFAPRHVLEYVVAHEVAHLAQMNHSRRFWAVVGQLCPGHEEARGWMNRHGHTLYTYG